MHIKGYEHLNDEYNNCKNEVAGAEFYHHTKVTGFVIFGCTLLKHFFYLIYYYFKFIFIQFLKNDTNKKLLSIVCVCWFITKLICTKLWLADRTFPLAPVSDVLLFLPGYVHTSLFIISLVCLTAIIFSSKKVFLYILLAAEILSCLCDQNRWQPWEYQFIFMLACYIFINDEKILRFSWKILFVGIYIYSGLNKLNSSFIHDIWQNIVLHNWFSISHPGIWLLRAGYILPMIEILAGAGFFFRRFQKLSICLLIAMHAFIILFFVPENIVILPWNLLMPVLLVSLFWMDEPVFKKKYFQNIFIWVTIIFWWIMPAFHFVGYWDKYLSSGLYTGGTEMLYICTNNADARRDMAPYFEQSNAVAGCDSVLSLYKWSMKEMNVPPYPERRLYNKIVTEFSKKYPDTGNRYYLYSSGFKPKLIRIYPE